MKRAVSIIVILVILAGAALLVRFLLKPDPQAILAKAERNLLFAPAVAYDVTMSATGDFGDVGFQGAAARKGTLTGSVSTDADLRTTPGASTSDFRFAFTDPTGAAEMLAGQSLKKDGVHYLKLTDATALGQAGADKLVGRWTKTRRHLLRWLFPPTDRELAERPLDAAGWSQMKETIAGSGILAIDDVLPDEGEGKDATWHFKVSLSHDNLIALLLEWRHLRTGVDTTQDDLIAATRAADGWGAPKGDIWIGKSDTRIRRLALSTAVQQTDGRDTLSADIVFSKYGAVPKIVAPEAEDLETVLGSVSDARLRLAGDRTFEASATSSPEAASATPEIAAAPDKELDTDGDGLPDTQEFFYGSDAWNPDTDGDGYSDGQEFDNGMSPTGPGGLFSFGLGG